MKVFVENIEKISIKKEYFRQVLRLIFEVCQLRQARKVPDEQMTGSSS